MLLYDFGPVPGPHRVRMFAAEKGIKIPLKQVNLQEQEQFSPEFRAINPDCTVPVLMPDEGEAICSAMPICYYLDALYPEPCLLGQTPLQRAHISMWNMRMEGIYVAGAQMLRNSNPAFKDRAVSGTHPVAQIPELGQRGADAYKRFQASMDERLADNQWIAGDNFSMADITAFSFLKFGASVGYEVRPELKNLQRWYGEISARPSAEA